MCPFLCPEPHFSGPVGVLGRGANFGDFRKDFGSAEPIPRNLQGLEGQCGGFSRGWGAEGGGELLVDSGGGEDGAL